MDNPRPAMPLTVSLHTSALEAHIVRGRLVAEGIPATVAFEHHVWANWSMSLALRGVPVQVPPSHWRAAREIVSAIHSGEYETLIDDGGCQAPSCPRCGADDTIVLDWPWKLALAFIFLFTLPLPYTTHLTTCRPCAHLWTAREQRGYPLRVVAGAMAILVLAFVGVERLVRHGYDVLSAPLLIY